MAGAAGLAVGDGWPARLSAQTGDAATVARIDADLVRHAGFGDKFSGSEGDRATAAWIAGRHFFAAVRRGSREAVEALLAAGARADAVALPRGMSMTALFLAAEADRLEWITLLVEAGAPLDARNTLGQSALGWSLAFGRTAAVERLLELGAAADQVDAMGRTPAALARELGMEDLAARLEERAAAD